MCRGSADRAGPSRVHHLRRRPLLKNWAGYVSCLFLPGPSSPPPLRPSALFHPRPLASSFPLFTLLRSSPSSNLPRILPPSLVARPPQMTCRKLSPNLLFLGGRIWGSSNARAKNLHGDGGGAAGRLHADAESHAFPFFGRRFQFLLPPSSFGVHLRPLHTRESCAKHGGHATSCRNTPSSSHAVFMAWRRVGNCRNQRPRPAKFLFPGACSAPFPVSTWGAFPRDPPRDILQRRLHALSLKPCASSFGTNHQGPTSRV